MFKNDIELNAALLKDFRIMIDELGEKLLEKLKEFIQTEVYDAGTPQWYHRFGESGGFLGSWQKEDVSGFGQTITSRIDQDINKMELDPESFVHGSLYWDVTEDVRDLLAEIINEGKSGPLFGNGFWRQPRQFWEPMMQFLTSGQADTVFESIMTAHGIKWIKI
jgi:hypothetical protein